MARPSKEYIRLARRELKRRAAKQSMTAFSTYVDPTYMLGKVHIEICRELDRFLTDVLEKRSPRLIICMPPRHGKSELVSRKFPAFSLGVCPDLEIISTSYSASLATKFNRAVQGIIDSKPFHEVFPKTALAGSRFALRTDAKVSRTTEDFGIVCHRGSYRSCGVGGGITGMGADIAIIDDPFKDRQEANSPTIREGVWDWYTSTLYTRLSQGGGVIVMCTRWHVDDLIGRLIDAQDYGDKWRIVNFPAIAEHDESFRKEGEALHPERFNLAALQQRRRAVGERDWASLYQQRPIPDGGTLFKREWIKYYMPDDLPETFDKVITSWDMTFKETAQSDFVVGQVWGCKDANFYLLDQVRKRMSFVDTVNAVIDLANRWPKATKKLVEDKANGTAVIDMLKNAVTGICPINPTESKQARASSVTPLWEAGNVHLPHPSIYPWVKTELVPELLYFPGGKHDDQVDAMSQALNDLKSSVKRMHPTNRAALLRNIRTR